MNLKKNNFLINKVNTNAKIDCYFGKWYVLINKDKSCVFINLYVDSIISMIRLHGKLNSKCIRFLM